MKHKIQIRKYVMDDNLSWEERYRELENHHREETKYLISVIEKYEEAIAEDKDGKLHCCCCDASPL